MAVHPTIRLTLPGSLAHRAIAVRVVAEACRLVTAPTPDGQPAPIDSSSGYDLRHPFDAEFVSAFAEIFNNIAIHAYQRRAGGEIELAIFLDSSRGAGAERDQIAVEIRDHGKTFDFDAVAKPDLDSLPEGGMGIHIARALLDEVSYEPGPPNLWRLFKRLRRDDVAATTAT